MFRVDEDLAVHINRGDAGNINVTANEGEYEFQPNSKLKLRIYEKKGYDKEPVYETEVTITEATTQAVIPLTEDSTSFCEISNKPITYWYDVSLDEDITLIGYDEDGAKEFIIYPAKLGEE